MNRKKIKNKIYQLSREGTSSKKADFSKKILKLKDPELSYTWDRYIAEIDDDGNEKFDFKAHEQIVIDFGTIDLNYAFAKDIRNADIKAHGKVIADSKDLPYNLKYLLNFNNKADVRLHGKVFIDDGNLSYNLCCITNIKGIDMKLHKKVIYDSKDQAMIDCMEKFLRVRSEVEEENLKIQSDIEFTSDNDVLL